MSVSVKIYGIAAGSNASMLETAIREFFLEKFRIASYGINVLFITCDSQVTGSPILAEVTMASNHVFTPERLRDFSKVFEKPTANREIHIGISRYTLFHCGENPERQPKTHAGQEAFPDWRKQPEKA